MLDTNFDWITGQTVPSLFLYRKERFVAYQHIQDTQNKREVSLHLILHRRYLHVNQEKYPAVWSIRLSQLTASTGYVESFQLVVTPEGEVVLDDLGVPCMSDNLLTYHPWSDMTEQCLRQYVPTIEALAKRLLPLAQLYILSDDWQIYGDPSKPFTYFRTIG